MPSAHFIIELSPPRPSQEVSPDLSQSSYIHHPAMLGPLRWKAVFQIGPNMHKRCHLEPAPIGTDQKIAQDYNRDHESVSKETLSVRIPGQEIVKLLNDGQVMLLFSFVKLEYGLTGLGIQGRNEISKGKSCRNNFRASRANKKTRSVDRRTQSADSSLAQIHENKKTRSAGRRTQSADSFLAQIHEKTGQCAFQDVPRKHFSRLY